MTMSRSFIRTGIPLFAARDRIRQMYPKIKADDTSDPRSYHVRKINQLFERIFRIMHGLDGCNHQFPKKGHLRIDYPVLGKLVLTKIEHWKRSAGAGPVP